MASSIGRPDGRRATREANLGLARALAQLPAFLSVDIEDGYADDPAEIADYVAALGAAGINIEDSTDERLVPPAGHAAKVAAIKARTPRFSSMPESTPIGCTRTKTSTQQLTGPGRT